MSKYSKINLVGRLQRWMDSENGQTFLNYAYSWGASVVILGTLFKLTHLPGADFFLFLGMGTEVFVFFISAFDRPFDKTTDGNNLTAEEENEMLTSGGQVKPNRLAPAQAPDNVLLELLNTRLSELEKMNRRLPDGQETDKIRETLVAIHQVYQQQLLKVSSQLTSIAEMDEKFKIQSAYLGELNKIYAKMIKAVGGKVMPEHEETANQDTKCTVEQ